jgi:hypothetical protein
VGAAEHGVCSDAAVHVPAAGARLRRPLLADLRLPGHGSPQRRPLNDVGASREYHYALRIVAAKNILPVADNLSLLLKLRPQLRHALEAERAVVLRVSPGLRQRCRKRRTCPGYRIPFNRIDFLLMYACTGCLGCAWWIAAIACTQAFLFCCSFLFSFPPPPLAAGGR